MTTTTAGIVFLVVLIAAVAAVHVPLGDYMYRVYTTEKHSRVERIIYRLIGADPKAEQTWGAYARSVLAFSAISVLFLFILQLVQGKLPLHLNDPGTPMTPALAWNTAISFVTNTNWQAYSGESTQGHLVQMAGLAVQNFVSAAVGMAVAMAFVRGLVRRNTGDLGNFWVDLVRGSLRILLPISVVGALILVGGGAIQNFALALPLAVVLIYLVMVALFRSFIDPLIILVAVPLGWIGTVLTLHLTNTSVNVESMIGTLMMMGIVVSNSILLVDFANRMVRHGATAEHAVLEAGRRRIRPILMTALATILGLLPLALGFGEGNETMVPLARAVVGGLAVSTIMTLLVVPIMHSLVLIRRERPPVSSTAPATLEEI